MRSSLEITRTTFSRSPLMAGAAAIVLLGIVGGLDVYTGRETSLILLYLIPISVAALAVGDKSAAGICIAATVIATAVRLDGKPLSPSETWNATTRLAVLLSWALLLGRMRHEPAPARVLRQLRLTCGIVVLLGLLAIAVALFFTPVPPAHSAISRDSARVVPVLPEGALAELANGLRECLAASRPILLGSRDPAGTSCVTIAATGSVQDSLPAHIADFNGGPGTTMAALFFFDRAGVTSAAADYNWQQTRLRTFLENERVVNAKAAHAPRELARRALELSEQLEQTQVIPDSLKPIGLNEIRTWPGYCLSSLDAAVAAKDLTGARRWASEFAAATFALDDLHRWLGFLVENHLRALEFQHFAADLFFDPTVAAAPYDARTSPSYFPAGTLGLNGVTNYLEIERRAEQLFTVPADWLSALADPSPWTQGSIWVPPGVRECYMKLYGSLSPKNQKTWRRAAKLPYENSYMVNMLYRAWKTDRADGLAEALRRFDALHPNAAVDQLMGAIMYRGHSFGGLEWADRYQPQLLKNMDGAFESDAASLFAAAQWTSRFNINRTGYDFTLTLRDTLATGKIACVRATDMIAAIHRNQGGTRVGFVVWSAGSTAHSVAALLDLQENQTRTMVIDGMSHAPQFEAWPDAYFQAHAWPPGFDGSPTPTTVELFARGLDNYVWTEGYIIRGSNAGVLARSAIPYLAGREITDVKRIFHGPYPE